MGDTLHPFATASCYYIVLALGYCRSSFVRILWRYFPITGSRLPAAAAITSSNPSAGSSSMPRHSRYLRMHSAGTGRPPSLITAQQHTRVQRATCQERPARVEPHIEHTRPEKRRE